MMPSMRKLLIAVVAAVLMAPFGSAQPADPKTLAFITNSATDFWKPAEAGVRRAQSELPTYTLVFKYLDEPTSAAQTRLLDELLAAGVAGIVVSPVDVEGMRGTLNRIAERIPLFTTDSDAPKSKRLAYFGSSNREAGKQAGEALRRALPDGGKCVGFIGLPGADNAQERIEGVKEAIGGTKIELVDVLGDGFDRARAKRNVEATLASRPEVNCMLGFYDYDVPAIYDAVKQAGKLGKIAIIGFDAEVATLAGIKEGTIAGTIVQQPYEWAYLSLTGMARYLEGDKSIIPPDHRVILPTRIIDLSNVDAFWTELKAVLCCMPSAAPKAGH